MAHIMLDGPGTAVQKGSTFRVSVNVQGAAPGSVSITIEQFEPPGATLATVDVVVLPEGTGSNSAKVKLDATGLVTVKATDTAGQLSSDTLTLMVNP